MSTVDVWLLAVPPGAGDDPAVLGLLSPAERLRVAGMEHPAVRAGSAAARAAARIVLGRLLGQAPGDVGLESEGRPLVSDASGVPSGVWVSWSHSGGWVALATSRHPVGIDIEQVPERLPARGLAFLGVASLDEFAGLEAASKATGCAFGGRWPPGIAWRRLAAPAGYVAAVAAPGERWDIEVHRRSPLDTVPTEPGPSDARVLSPPEALCYARPRPMLIWGG